MKLSFKPTNTIVPPIEFRDVPINSFYEDYQQDLMFKISPHTAIRIACKDGILNEQSFDPAWYTNVIKILPFTEVEW